MNIEAVDISAKTPDYKSNIKEKQQEQEESLFYDIKPAQCKMGSKCYEFDETNLNDNERELYHKMQESYSNGLFKKENYDTAIKLMKNCCGISDITSQFNINKDICQNNNGIFDKIKRLFK